MNRRVFLIDPIEKSIREFNIAIDAGQLDPLIGGRASTHWVVSKLLPDHEGWVNPQGLINGRELWFFHGCHIWGPMVVCGHNKSDAKCTRKALQTLVSFTAL